LFNCSIVQNAAATAAQGSFLYANQIQGETGKVGVVREIKRAADNRVIKAELHPPHRTGRRLTARPSTLSANDLGFQELAAALRPVATGVEARTS